MHVHLAPQWRRAVAVFVCVLLVTLLQHLWELGVVEGREPGLV